MRKRAQAALEFLMTYGWAILIMLVVIAVLFFLGVFSPQATVSKSCTLPAGFTCFEFDMDSSGNIYLDLGQATGKTITVTGIGCAPSSPNATLNPNVQIPTGSHAIVTIGGTNCSGATNSAFKGKLLIQYTISGSSGTRSVTGDLSAPLIGNSSSWGSGSYSGWTFLYRRQVTINTNVTSDLTDFPAYFILNTNSLISGGKMNNSCKDLRVLDSTMSTLLDYEIENNTCNTTSTVVWFRVPQTKANLTSLAYVFYGNSSSADAQNKAGVWRNGFVAVYHLGGGAADSIGTNHGTLYGPANSSGKFGDSLLFDGISYIACGSGSGLSFGTGDFSYSAWIKMPSLLSKWQAIINKGASGATGYGMTITSANVHTGDIQGTGGTNQHVYSLVTLPAGAWTHLAAVFDRDDLAYIYMNGGQVANSTYAAGNTNSVTSGTGMSLGGVPSSTWNFSGNIDELRMSNVMRTADWIKAEYGQTYVVGSEQVN